jgi:hypothetical protein
VRAVHRADASQDRLDKGAAAVYDPLHRNAMKKPASLESRFGAASHGVRWASSLLPGAVFAADGGVRAGSRDIAFAPLPGAAGPDDFAVERPAGRLLVRANSATGAIAALLRLGDGLRAGRPAALRGRLRLRTRNYKHELRLSPRDPRWVGRWTDAMWEALCQRLEAHQFNGLVFYAGYHPFEHILDYREYLSAASQPEADCAATRAALRRGLTVAHRYGLTTFLQHYVGHFTKELADAHCIPTTGRFSNTEHPEVEKYCRWCYREIFRQLPELDGLYFNFESYQNAARHVLATAVPVCNRMPRKPVFVFRLWGFRDYAAMKRMLGAYRGRAILGHKISDTNDTYYLPVADSRVMEWKKRLGRRVEWMFLVGPCHNCGTNLCTQLWSDYDFVQAILADAQAKGADSISFHTVHELFAADLPAPDGVFSEHELDVSRFNRLHVLAASDYANGVTRTPAERAAVLAGLNGIPAKAGKPLYEAILASSQQVLLAYRQFHISSSRDGYLNRGRHAAIQEPFYYFPVTELNHQARKPMFNVGWPASWVTKTIDTVVTPPNEYQYILDSVDPSQSRARCHPAALADQLDACADASLASLAALRRAGGKMAAARLEPYLRQNAVLGRYISREIRAAIHLYAIYFAKTPAAVAAAIRDGLAELKAAAALIPDRDHADARNLRRALMLDIDPAVEIALAEELRRFWKPGQVPMVAFAEWVASHRHYNEIRRLIRPHRLHGEPSLREARRRLDAARAAAEKALAALGETRHAALRANVAAWRDYLVQARAETVRPAAVCAPEEGTPWLPLHHDDCFRAGEDFLEDFVGFFRPIDYARRVLLAFRVRRERDALVVTLREEGVGLEARRPRWLEHRGEGSDSYVLRVFLDTENGGRRGERYIAWPAGGGLSRGPRANLPGSVEIADEGRAWTLTARMPFSMLGRTPRRGETWGFNVTANPFVTRNTCYTWASQYDSNNPKLYGRITFGEPAPGRKSP